MLAGRASGCRSAREVLLVIALVASVSALVTYHLTKSLPLRSDPSMQLVFERRMQVYDNVGVSLIIPIIRELVVKKNL